MTLVIFSPHIEGTASVRASSVEFLASFRDRVESGFLAGRPHVRSRYVITRMEPQALHVSAADWRTAFNVGLNEIDIRMLEAGELHYSIRYPRWAAYALGLSAGIAVLLMTALFTIDLRSYIEQHQDSMPPGLSIDQQVRAAWGLIVFWGFVWPWLLIAFHKRPLRRLFVRIVAEVDAAAVERIRHIPPSTEV